MVTWKPLSNQVSTDSAILTSVKTCANRLLPHKMFATSSRKFVRLSQKDLLIPMGNFTRLTSSHALLGSTSRLLLHCMLSVLDHYAVVFNNELLTGFSHHSEFRGAGGVDMHQTFNPEPQVYLGVAAPNFPNYFIVNGVRGNWAAGTVLITVSHANYLSYVFRILLILAANLLHLSITSLRCRSTTLSSASKRSNKKTSNRWKSGKSV